MAASAVVRARIDPLESPTPRPSRPCSARRGDTRKIGTPNNLLADLHADDSADHTLQARLQARKQKPTTARPSTRTSSKPLPCSPRGPRPAHQLSQPRARRRPRREQSIGLLTARNPRIDAQREDALANLANTDYTSFYLSASSSIPREGFPMALNHDQRAIFERSKVVEEARSAAGNDGQKLTEIGRLFAQLCEHDRLSFSYQAEKAFKKYADRIIYGIKIFISYKIGFETAARNVIEPFKIYGNGRILVNERFPYMCERVPDVGQEYRDKIYAALEQAHWFFLLLPDESLDRSWTLFEAGYFKRAMAIEDRLIGIHHSNVKMAGPLTNLDAVAAEAEKICSFLQKLLHQPNPIPGMSPINPAVSVEWFHSHSENISRTIQPSRQINRQYRIDYMDIKLESSRPPKDAEELPDAVVIEANGLKDIFGFAGFTNKTDRLDADLSKEITLRQIIMRSGVSRISSSPDDSATTSPKESKHIYWLRAMVEAIQAAFHNDPYGPSDVILTGKDEKYYRPPLLSIRRYTDTDEPESAHIAFHESVMGPIRNCPEELSALGTILRMGYRFKWEVLERFRFITVKSDVDTVRQIIERMERESHQRGLHQPDRPIDENLEHNPVFAAFSPELQPVIREIGQKWEEFRNCRKTGRLDRAFEQSNTKETQECLRELREINRTFMKIGASRYAELVNQYWD